jgi:hypothetical protein
MEMVVRSMETAETAMEIDGDGSWGTFLSWQGAGMKTSVPRNSSAAMAELWNSFWKFADCSRVFYRESLYRRRGIVRSGPGPPHHTTARPRGRATLGCACPLAPSGSLSVLVLHPGKIGVSAFILSNYKNISYVAFLKHKNSRKQGTGTVASCQ